MGRYTNRLNRLQEAVATYRRLRVVFGMNQADLERRLAEFEASDVPTDGDTVICVKWLEAENDHSVTR
jgi:hypothetical protein